MAYKGGTLKSGTDNYYPNAYYKVGDLFLTTNSENPSLRFGGTWELFGKGKTLVCVDDSDDDFSTVKKTGGSKYLQSHTHGIPQVHPWNEDSDSHYSLERFQNTKAIGYNVETASAGKGNSGNLQPYITCYIWIRIK